MQVHKSERQTSLLFMLCSLIVYFAIRRCRYTISRTSVGSFINGESCSLLPTAATDPESEGIILAVSPMRTLADFRNLGLVVDRQSYSWVDMRDNVSYLVATNL